MKKTLSLLLAVAMLISLLPSIGVAADEALDWAGVSESYRFAWKAYDELETAVKIPTSKSGDVLSKEDFMTNAGVETCEHLVVACGI